jgi:hypothetical protein
MATTVAGSVTYFESDGKAVDVDLLYTVAKGAVAVVEGWVGIAGAAGVSGDEIALAVDNREYQVEVPTGLSVSKGDIIYITVATITGHYPDDEAYTTSAGEGKVAFMKATADKDANDIVTGIMLAAASLAS